MTNENDLGEPITAQVAAFGGLDNLMQFVGLIADGCQISRRLVAQPQTQPVQIQRRVSGTIGRIDKRVSAAVDRRIPIGVIVGACARKC
jgi:hypothetical protein